jgi:hypothetical protein
MKKKNVFLTALAVLGLATISMGQTIPSYVPANGLIGWWPFNSNANDESGKGNNGTVSNVTLTADRFGVANSAYAFNGSTSRIDITNAFFDIAWNQFTISCWMHTVSANNPNNYNDSKPLINTDGHRGLAISTYGDNNPFTSLWDNKYVLLGGSDPVNYGSWDIFGSNIPVSSNEVTLGSWNNIIVVKDANKYSVYINGVLDNVGTSIITTPSTFCKMVFGALGSNTTPEVFLGELDDYGIWNRALTSNEISNLYSGNVCYQNITVTDTLVINTNITGFNPITYQNTIKVWPNPTNDHVTIDNGNFATLKGYQLKISNTMGQQLFQSDINQQQFYIDMTSWGGKGLYFVNIINAQGVTIDTRKIVLQ